ncbi:MAG TPA: DUF1080 domain-containing protein [Polyangiaceae bacterium]|nr:DUF1080 domain-containing protein [Polyangiaceae bacterium]
MTMQVLRLAVVPVLCVGVGCGGAAAVAPPPSPDTNAAVVKTDAKPVALFNGKDLTGWVQVLDSKWTVNNGVLMAKQDPKGRREGESWLLTEKDYADFVLTLKFKVSAGGNSGIFMRDPIPRADRLKAADGGPNPWEIGLEANIQADNPDWSTGCVYAIGKAPKGLEKIGEWNDFKAKVQGNHVTVWINGQLGADTDQTRTKKGAIGFQRHGTPKYADKLVEIKEVYIEEL